MPARTRKYLIILTEAEGRAQIRVRDDGPGFPPDLLDHVFQRFAKGDKSEGHGLGLAFVRAVAFAHGGRASVRNLDSPGGAEIVVELPTLGPNPDPHFDRADRSPDLLPHHVDASK